MIYWSGCIILQNNAGLFTSLKGFILQANNMQLTRKEREMWNITTKALLHLGVILVVDVFFHYLYILTIPSDMKLVTKLSDWCLGELDICNNNGSGTPGSNVFFFFFFLWMAILFNILYIFVAIRHLNYHWVDVNCSMCKWDKIKSTETVKGHKNIH